MLYNAVRDNLGQPSPARLTQLNSLLVLAPSRAVSGLYCTCRGASWVPGGREGRKGREGKGGDLVLLDWVSCVLLAWGLCRLWHNRVGFC